MSKANLYHYYKDKDELLFDVIRVHLEELLANRSKLPTTPIWHPPRGCATWSAALLEAYRDADSQHNVQISSLRFLSAERQAHIEERWSANSCGSFPAPCSASRRSLQGTKMLKPVTMSLFGMLNWHYLWFREPGSDVTRADYADLVTQADRRRHPRPAGAARSSPQTCRRGGSRLYATNVRASHTEGRSHETRKLRLRTMGGPRARTSSRFASAVSGDVVAQATSGGDSIWARCWTMPARHRWRPSATTDLPPARGHAEETRVSI